MELLAYNAFCGSLPHAAHVVQWGGAHVWKIGGKVFAVGGWQMENAQESDLLAVTFKCSPMSFEMLKQQAGLRPAPYLASRGMSWIQRVSAASMDDTALKDRLRESYRLASLNLTKKVQRELKHDNQPVVPLLQRTRSSASIKKRKPWKKKTLDMVPGI